LDEGLEVAEKAKRQREAEEFGCFGLVGGSARRLHTREAVHASEVTKAHGPFYCAECNSDAIVKKCIEKIDHFAHDAPRSPAGGAFEGRLHKDCKDEIQAALVAKYPEGHWMVERPFRAKQEKKLSEVRPDISGRIDGVPLVIEVQASALSISAILKRTVNHFRRGIPVLWIVPLREPLSDAPFRPWLYERYFHSMYYGRTYYWWPGMGATVQPVHYGIATRHIPYSEWYEEGGEHREAGGFEAKYKAIKRPLLGPAVDISLGFAATPRDEFTPENEKKAVPACKLWMDQLDAWWDASSGGRE
jgi:competence protein CoiA